MKKLPLKKACSLLRRQPAWPFREVDQSLKIVSSEVHHHLFQPEMAHDYDLCVTWNNYGPRGDLGKKVADKGGHHVVMENGYLGPHYLAVDRSGFNGLGNTPKMSDPRRFQQQGHKILPYKKKGSHILVCAQMGGSYSPLSMPKTWPDEVIRELRQHTDREILYRPHPTRQLYPTEPVEIAGLADPLDHFLDDCWAVVVYTSSVANRALLRGIPVFYCGPAIICQEAAHRGVEDIENPTYFDREHVFHDIAWRQWSLDEIKQGVHWDHVLQR